MYINRCDGITTKLRLCPRWRSSLLERDRTREAGLEHSSQRRIDEFCHYLSAFAHQHWVHRCIQCHWVCCPRINLEYLSHLYLGLDLQAIPRTSPSAPLESGQTGAVREHWRRALAPYRLGILLLPFSKTSHANYDELELRNLWRLDDYWHCLLVCLGAPCLYPSGLSCAQELRYVDDESTIQSLAEQQFLHRT